MTGKDFLKLLLCIYEYDTDIEIETERNFGDITYEVTATNKRTLDVYHGFDEGLYSAVYSIIKYMTDFQEDYIHTIEVEDDPNYPVLIERIEDDGHSFPPELSPTPSYKWAMFSIKDILNDEFRDKMRKKWIEQKKYIDMYNDFFKELEEKLQDSMPCRSHEKCKDRVWRDDCVNDFCELHYTMQCPKLRKWMAEDKRLRDIRNEEWKKYCEENNIINPYKN
jgi:hypothetical protein